jgi:hypothetical protein
MSNRTSQLGIVATGILSRRRFHGRLPWVPAIIGAGLLFVAHVSSGRQAEQEVIRAKVVVAERFMLDSPDPNVGATFGVDPAGQASIVFFGLRPFRHLSIGVYKDGLAGLSMRRDEPKTRINLVIQPSGSPTLRLASDLPKAELDLRVRRDHAPWITLIAQDGPALSISGPGEKDQSAAIALSPKVGKPTIRMSDSRELTSASMFDSEGHIRTLVGWRPGDAPHFFLYDRDIHAMLEMTEEGDGTPVIKINDPVARESRVLK